MAIPEWILFTFIFVLGCCVGSFLNVVIYRLPRNKSIVMPPSACPACGRHIHFYDNIPLISWLILGRKCRYCKAPISPRYFIVELLTGVLFCSLFFISFRTNLQQAGIPPFQQGGWFLYLIAITLLSTLLAASAIDMELWVIPISLCWFITAAGLVAATLAHYVIDPAVIRAYVLLPSASVKSASLAAGAAVGLTVSLILVATGAIKRSYECEQSNGPSAGPDRSASAAVNDRIEVCREILFLLPIVLGAAAGYWMLNYIPELAGWWLNFSQHPSMAGLLGSLWGYFVGGAVVWITRILGTLTFGKEAMGLGDVHLMAGAGTVIGPVCVVVAFFIAPFFGLAWAAGQMFFKKTRQIPYGPFLSLAVFVVIILHHRIFSYLNVLRFQ